MSEHSQAEIDEAAESLMLAILTTYADSPDDEVMPLRLLMVAIGNKCRVQLMTGEIMQIPQEITVGELRARMRMGRADLAGR